MGQQTPRQMARTGRRLELDSSLTTHRLLHTTAPGRKPLEPMRAGTAKLEGASQNRRHTPQHMESQQSLRAAATAPGLLAKASSFYSDGMTRPSGIPGLGYNQSSKLYP